jgi:hypothetical protein
VVAALVVAALVVAALVVAGRRPDADKRMRGGPRGPPRTASSQRRGDAGASSAARAEVL